MTLTQKRYLEYMACITMPPELRNRYFERLRNVQKPEVISQEAQKLLDAIRANTYPEVSTVFNGRKAREKGKSDGEIAQLIIDEAKKGTLVVSESERNGFVEVKTNARKIVVIGDVQGAFDEMVDSLLYAKVIVERENSASFSEWKKYIINPNLEDGTQVVFIGDYFDRGPKGMEVLQFVMELKEQEAELARIGRRIGINTLIGNHEFIWLRIFDLFGSEKQEEVEGLFTNFVKEIKIEKLRGTSFEDANKEKISAFEIGIPLALRGDGPKYRATFNSILRKFEGEYEEAKREDSELATKEAKGEMDLWRFAVAKMQEREIQFIKSLKAVVRIDDLLFTHAGPVFGARNLEELNTHYKEKFGEFRGSKLHENSWGYIVLDALPKETKERLFDEGDYSSSYCGVSEEISLGRGQRIRAPWKQDGGIMGWLRSMGAKHIYVGHESQNRIETDSRRGITNVDGGMCYARDRSSAGGILVIDPFAQHIVKVDGEFVETRERSRDLSQGRTPTQAIGNIYSQIAEIIA